MTAAIVVSAAVLATSSVSFLLGRAEGAHMRDMLWRRVIETLVDEDSRR
ncbi:hypothetical protein [Gordonia sp. i37]|nr:hypothetical protein [Gordonia sp. i37]